MTEQERQEVSLDTEEVYPLVALKNMVVFPRTRMTLAIAREKSVRAVEEAMMRPDRALITAPQRDPDIDDPQPKDIYDTGALVEITTMHRQQDGSLQVLLSGLHRVTDTQQQQDLLDTFDPLERLEKVCVIMGNEIEILELESTIRSRVRSQVDRTQKEYYLREQLRAIQEELGMETSSEVEELRARVNEKHLPAEAMAKIRKEIDRLERTPAQSAEVDVLR